MKKLFSKWNGSKKGSSKEKKIQNMQCAVCLLTSS